VSTESDRELLAAIGDRDHAALKVLYQRHASWLVIRLTRRCADPGLVDEVVQDTFLAVWRKPKSYGERGEVAAWIWGIAIRRLIDALRRHPKRHEATVAAPSAGESAEEHVLLGVEYGDLGGAMNALSPELRAVVQATVLDGLTTREAAKLLGIPAGTVKTRMMRAKAHLREELA
jgi:RNA polymerase sigma-70 factor, ECF subfamily